MRTYSFVVIADILEVAGRRFLSCGASHFLPMTAGVWFGVAMDVSYSTICLKFYCHRKLFEQDVKRSTSASVWTLLYGMDK